MDDSARADAAAGLVALCNCLGAIAFGNEAGHGSAGRFRLHRPVDGNPTRAYGHIRRTPHWVPGLSAFGGLGGGEVSRLRTPERAFGTIYHPGGVATRVGNRNDGVSVVATVVFCLPGLVAFYACWRREGFGSVDFGCIR